MKNTEIIEISVMYNRVKDLNDPKEVLEAIAKLETEMGWSDVVGIRFATYALWLRDHGKDDWFEYLRELQDFLGALQFGVFKEPPTKTPEGRIAPVPYFKGEIQNEGARGK